MHPRAGVQESETTSALPTPALELTSDAFATQVSADVALRSFPPLLHSPAAPSLSPPNLITPPAHPLLPIRQALPILPHPLHPPHGSSPHPPRSHPCPLTTPFLTSPPYPAPGQFATFFSTAQAYTLGVIRAKITLAVLHADARYWIVGHALAWIVYISAMALAWLSMHRESEEAMIGSVMAQLAYLGWSIRVIVDFDFLWSWFNAPQEAEQRLYRESFMPHKTVSSPTQLSPLFCPSADLLARSFD